MESFRNKVSKLNGLDGSEEAFRSLPSGTELVLPYLPGEEPTLDEEALRKQIREEVLQGFASERSGLESKIRLLEKRLGDNKRGFLDGQSIWFLSFTVVCLIVNFGVIFWLIYVRRMRGEEIVVQNQEIFNLRHSLSLAGFDNEKLKKEAEVQKFFLDLYAVKFVLPKDIGSVFGGDTLYILKSREAIDGEDAVLVFNSGNWVRIKQKNLKKFFDERGKAYDAGDRSTFEHYGITRTIPDTLPFGSESRVEKPGKLSVA